MAIGGLEVGATDSIGPGALRLFCNTLSLKGSFCEIVFFLISGFRGDGFEGVSTILNGQYVLARTPGRRFLLPGVRVLDMERQDKSKFLTKRSFKMHVF